MQCMEPRFASSDVIWPFKAWLRLGPYQILAETKLDSILHIYNYTWKESPLLAHVVLIIQGG